MVVTVDAETRAVDAETRAAERDLVRLFPALDAEILNPSDEQLLAFGFGLRGRELYQDVRGLVNRRAFVAAAALERVMLDVMIIARWLEVAPKLHMQMWLGEDARHSMMGLEAIAELHERRLGQRLPINKSDRERLMTTTSEARAAGLAAKEPIGKKKAASVLPAAWQMLEVAPDLWEAYRVAYPTLSAVVHAGGRSFVADRIVIDRRGKARMRPGAPFDASSLRALAVPIMCSLLATVSRQCGLGIEGAADTLRIGYTVWQEPLQG